MNVSLLISLFALMVPGPQVPNYYRSYPTARAEASKAGKEMLIFFSSSSCTNCDGAWAAYSKDGTAVNTYISTQVGVDNFDGQILYDHFDPGSVPAWIIMDANGNVKERWQGGWKDAYGKGTLFVEEIPLTATPKKPEAASASKPVTPTSTPVVSNTTSKTSPASTDVKEPVAHTETPAVKKDESPAKTTSNISAGFVIQAGYFGSATNAQKCLADLKTKGFSQFSIQPLQQNGSTFYQVWSNSFSTEQAAQTKLQELSAAGIKGTVKSSS